MLAEQAARDGCDIVVAVGGDGTLHEIVNGLMRGRPDHPPALAVIPAGTANIFARALDLPTEPAAAARVLAEGVRRRIDVGQVNDRYFTTVAGAGLDGAVVRLASRWPRWIGGKPRHAAAGLVTLAGYRAARVRVWLDGLEQAESLILLAAANTAWYGGGIHIAPAARPDDGLLSVVFIRDVGRLELLHLVRLAVSGKHLNHPRTGHAPAREVRAEADIPLPVQADGEDLGVLPARFRCVPAAIDLIVPPRAH
jgi:diacylglycerol kinase (ATP)